MDFNEALKDTNFKFPGQSGFYKGKVRDTYFLGEYLIMVTTDRISAFDVILPNPIPYKGQVLNQTAAYFLQATRDIVPNWLIAVPDPNVCIGYLCEPLKIEMVIRGYLAGHAWRLYAQGKREICGIQLPNGLKENDKLPEPIITPTTKTLQGHDEDISEKEILEKELVTQKEYEIIKEYTYKLFAKGQQMAAQRGLILVDTKYEFGKKGDQILLIDEIHTPDSSRYFYLETYEDLQKKGLPQKQLSKEFVRKWLIENNFQGKEGQKIPNMDKEVILKISERYIELYENVTGQKFIKQNYTNALQRIENSVLSFLTNKIG
jgi:phosphoribosylaminoimidazole-succinocarboxamide synthase